MATRFRLRSRLLNFIARIAAHLLMRSAIRKGL